MIVPRLEKDFCGILDLAASPSAEKHCAHSGCASGGQHGAAEPASWYASVPPDLVWAIGLVSRLGADGLRARRVGVPADGIGHTAHTDLVLRDTAVHRILADRRCAGGPLGPALGAGSERGGRVPDAADNH